MDGIPAESPAYAGEVDEYNSSGSGVFRGAGLDFAGGDSRHGGEVDGDVEHGDELDDDSDGKRAFAADEIDEEECADES